MLEERRIHDAKILIVDDEPMNVILLEETLGEQGYGNVRGETDPREAVSLYPEFQPDIVLLDLNMPHMDGFEVMRRISEYEQEQYVPVLVLTGQQDRETRLKALSAGAKDFLTKPLDLTEVTLRVRNLLEVRLLYSQLRESHEELETSNADLEQFAYVASHDLQTPLRSVARYVQMLERRYADDLDERARGYIERAVAGSKRMEALIRSLLDYSRVGSRGGEFLPTDAKALVEDVVEDLAPTLAETGGEVACNGLPVVNADETQLRQVFQNLIGNGVKFRGEAPPRVEVSAERQNGEWVFSVRDNGIGIDPEYHDQVFVIFQRLHGTGQYPGTGIGLALCKRMIERHHGRMWVESTPGGGSTFYFSLPA